jgi:hypothetical protein
MRIMGLLLPERGLAHHIGLLKKTFTDSTQILLT